MPSKLLLRSTRRRKSLYGLHLFAAVFAFHVLIVEGVLVAASLRGLACPEDYFGRVGERSATQVWGRVGLLPDYVVQEAKAVSQQGHANARVDVQRA